MKGFDLDRFREIFEDRPWASLDELDAAVAEDGVVSEEFRDNAEREARRTAIRYALRQRDPETGEPLGVSIVGLDGTRRYKSPKLFDDSDYRTVITDRRKRIIHFCQEIRHYEHKAGVPLAEQISFDFSWIDEEENAA